MIAGKMTTRGEQLLWQRQYLDCCSELGQWDIVNDYAKSAENYGTFMDAAWKNNDWTVSCLCTLCADLASMWLPLPLRPAWSLPSMMAIV